MRDETANFPAWTRGSNSRTLWPDVHSSLITAIRDELTPVLAPRYFVGVETRTTVVAELDIDRIYRPDVTVHSTAAAW